MNRLIHVTRWSRLFAIAAPLLSAACLAQTPMFTVQVLGNLPGAAPGGAVYGINDAGEAVGFAGGGASICPSTCAVVWRDGIPTPLGPVGTQSVGVSVNNANQVVGIAYGIPPFYPYEAVIWNNGSPSVLTAPAGSQYTATYPASINDSGQAAGTAYVGAGYTYDAVVWNGTTPVVLGLLPGYTSASASGINSDGLVVGYMCCSHAEYEAVVWHGTVPTMLRKISTSPKSSGQAVGVNNSGIVVGHSINATVGGFRHGTAWANGEVTDLGTLSYGASAIAVNNRGVIVGYTSTVSNGEPHAALWSRVGAELQDLNTLINAGAAKQVQLTGATGINDSCTIVANGTVRETQINVALLLTLTDPTLCVNGL